MLETPIQFEALTDLRRDVRSAKDIHTLSACLWEFGQRCLGIEIRLVLSTAVTPPYFALGADTWQTPIGQTGYLLQVDMNRALGEKEIHLLELAADVLLNVPYFANWVQVSPLQLRLLQELGLEITSQQRLSDIWGALGRNFEMAFPGTQPYLMRLERQTNLLTVQPFLGGQLGDVSAMVGEEVTHQVIVTGSTAVLAANHPPRVLVPVKIQEKVEGVLQVDYAETAVIPTSDIMVLELLAGLIAIALNKENIITQAWQKANQLETIYKVTESALSLKPLGPTLEDIHKKLMTAFDTDTCYIALYNFEKQTISFPCYHDSGEPRIQEDIAVSEEKSLSAWVILNNQPYATDDWQLDSRPVVGIVDRTYSRSLICVPMRVGDEVLGAISVQSDKQHAFDAADFQSLTAVASHIAIIVKNASHYTATKEMMDQGSRDYVTAVALRQAIATISNSLDQSIVLNNLLLALSRIITYSTAYVFLLEEDRFQLAAIRDFYNRSIHKTTLHIEQAWQNSPLLQEIRQSRATIRLDNVSADPRWMPFPGGEEIRSWLGTPLILRNELIGVLILNSHNDNAFDRHQEWLASTLATHTAIAIQNARLHQKTEQQLAELGTLYQASATMTANLDQDFVLQTVVAEMVRALQVDTCTIFVWDENLQHLNPVAHQQNANLTYSGDEGRNVNLIQNLEAYPVVRSVFEFQELRSLRRDNVFSDDQLALLDTAGLQSLLLVPLVRRQQLLGLLALGQVQQLRSFNPGQLRLTQNLAGQAAVAIEHARLFGQVQRRVDELSTFHQIVLKLNTPLELKAVLDAITDSALRLVNASNLHIYLYDAKTQQFTAGSALWADGRREPAVANLRSQGITTSVVQQAKPIVINNAQEHPLFQSEQAKLWGIHAIAGFPLKQGENVIGAFTITYLYPHLFTDDELLLLNLLADQAAVAVKNAGLFAEAERRYRDMEALVSMAKQVTSDLKLHSVLQTTVQMLQRLLNARASTITMLTEDGEELEVVAATGIKPEFKDRARMKLGQGVSGRVVRTGQLIYIENAHTEPNFLFFDAVIQSLLVVPLISRDIVIGTLTVDSDRPYAFSKSDIQFMTIAAAQVSVAIDNARLFEEVEKRAAELALAYEEVKESDRLKDELVQNVSHELRTPLTFVRGYVDLLIEGEMGLLNADQLEALHIVSGKTGDITRLIEDIMALQRIDANNLQLQEASMSDLIEATVAGHRLIASDKGLKIVHELPATGGHVLMDTGRINQVLDNLIGNALKFSPDGGTITIRMVDSPDEVSVVVSDQGIGVPKDRLGRIFERFYQVDGTARRRFSGAGLGLAIAKRIIDAHAGKIWVESELNQGSSFYFTLPKKS